MESKHSMVSRLPFQLSKMTQIRSDIGEHLFRGNLQLTKGPLAGPFEARSARRTASYNVCVFRVVWTKESWICACKHSDYRHVEGASQMKRTGVIGDDQLGIRKESGKGTDRERGIRSGGTRNLSAHT